MAMRLQVGDGQTLLDLPAGPSGDGSDSVALCDVTFVVVDLETTGGSPADCAITEIGAVKVCGGEVLGEFQTLVRPDTAIPPFIALLTGITDSMVVGAPAIGAALPAFLEFASGAVLVAHNARFDVGFLRAACAATETSWPSAPVIDTVTLARHVVTSDEVPDRKLSSLARLFASPTTPNHRALIDARATVDVLHALLERVGSIGVHTLGDLRTFSSRVPPATRRKRHLADDVPHAPGVYLFHDGDGRVLYVGTSVDLRARVRSYFTAAEQRSRMRQMIALAEGVTAIPCGTALEGRVRELRLIAEHAPPFNRRSRFPNRVPWLKLTAEPYPRLSVVRDVRADGGSYLGPFSSIAQAELAAGALQEAYPLRRCAGRLPRRPRAGASACLLADLGRCAAPCIGGIDVDSYAGIAGAVRRAMTDDATTVVTAALGRAGSLATDQRYEDAGMHRDRMVAFLRGAARSQRLAPLSAIPEIVAARRRERGGWEIVVIRHGRLAGTCTSPPGASPVPYIEALTSTADVVAPRPPPLPAASPEESELILGWLEQPGVRLVELEGEWSCPITGAGAARSRLGDLRPASARGRWR